MVTKNNIIYFNNNRTTQADPRVEEAMASLEKNGVAANSILETSLSQICALLNCTKNEIVLTTGTQEAMELGFRLAYKTFTKEKNHIITCKTEHPIILKCCRDLENKGATVTYLDVDREGIIDIASLDASITKATAMICIMLANNETGVIQPYESITERCKQHGILFFSDATQFVGKLRTDTSEMGIDMLVFNGHKMYGPKGIAVLYINRQHQNGSGMNLPPHSTKSMGADEVSQVRAPKDILVAGLAEAAKIFNENYWDDMAAISKLRAWFEHQLLDIEGLRINGSTRHRLYNTSNLQFPPQKDIKSLLSHYDFAANTSAPSHVLAAMGLTGDEIKNSFRFSFGKYNTLEEVKGLVEAIHSL